MSSSPVKPTMTLDDLQPDATVREAIDFVLKFSEAGTTPQRAGEVIDQILLPLVSFSVERGLGPIKSGLVPVHGRLVPVQRCLLSIRRRLSRVREASIKRRLISVQGHLVTIEHQLALIQGELGTGLCLAAFDPHVGGTSIPRRLCLLRRLPSPSRRSTLRGRPPVGRLVRVAGSSGPSILDSRRVQDRVVTRLVGTAFVPQHVPFADILIPHRISGFMH